MRIVVNDIAASKGGAMSVLRDFYACVCERDHENEWIFLLSNRYFAETANVKILTLPEIKKSRLKKLWFDLVSGKTYIAALKPDVVLSLQNIITFGLKVPQVVYVHQSIPFQTVKRFSFLKKEERGLAVIQHLIGRIIKQSARKSDCIIVQTQWMKDAVCKMCHLPLDKVMTSVPPVPMAKQLMPGALDPTAFFYPTAEAVYKNNDCIFQASRRLEEKGISHSVTLTLPPERTSGSVSCVGRMPYNAVIDHYRRMTLLFPSYIETFGYPLAEARAAGSVVLASDTPFSREVLANYENAYFFDPFKPEELALLMEKTVTGVIKRRSGRTNTQPTGGWSEVMEQVLRIGV